MNLNIYILVFIFAVQSLVAENQPKVALFNIDEISSESFAEPNLTDLLNKDSEPKTYMSFISRLRLAAKDSNMRACVFYGENPVIGLAQKEELQRHIAKLKDAKIKTYFYAKNLSMANIFVAASTDKIVLFPEGEVVFNGLHLQNLYFKNLMDKIGVEADVIHVGDFKSAGEPFYLTQPSSESAAQTKMLAEELAAQLEQSLVKNRQMKLADVKKLRDKGIFSAKEALKESLVDDLKYHNEFIEDLKKEIGRNSEFSKKFGVVKKKEIQMKSLLDVFTLLNELSAPPKKDLMDKISLTIIENTINEEMGELMRRHILTVAKDKTVKAMVLRINSPGGSAQASEIMHHALLEFKNAGKPLIVSMGDVAASGGYYVAAPGDKIFAENSTITGSIGVVGGKIVIGGLLDKIGITTHDYTIGKHADIMTTTRKMNEEEKELMLKAFNRVYETFKKRVTDGRGKKLQGDIESIAGGRVYSGSQALKIGLIDEIGGLRDALNYTVDVTKLTQYKIVMFPEELNLENILGKVLRGEEEDEEVISLGKPQKIKFFQENSSLQQHLKSINEINPELAKQLQLFLNQLQVMANENIILIAPQLNY